MAIISDATKIDRLFKFVNGKGYTTTDKNIDNEDVPAGLIIGSSSIFTEDASIPTTAPGISTSILTFHSPTSRFIMINDISSPTNRAWYASTNDTSLITMRATRVSNWISPVFGNYTIRIFLTNGSSNSATPVQEIFFSDQTAPIFDYKVGVLTFETDPLTTYADLSPVPDGIQISGYVYSGASLDQSFDNNGNIKSSLASITSQSIIDANVASASFILNGALTVSSPDAYGPDWVSEDNAAPFGSSGHTWASTWQTPNGTTIVAGTSSGSTAFYFARSYADGYWHASSVTSSGTATGVWGADNFNIFATTTSGSHPVLKSIDGGVSWDDIVGPSINNANAIWGSSLNNIYIFGNDGYIARSIDTGDNFYRASTWTNLSSAFSNTINGINYTVLSDGRIFALADQSTQAQILDPVADSVFNTTSINTTVSGASLVTLPNNKVAVMGGINSGIISDIIQIYDITGDSWSTSTAILSEAKFNSASILLTTGPNAGKALITGGETDLFLSATGSCDIYDPLADTISSAALFVPYRSQHKLVMLQDGYVLLNGGQVSDTLYTDLLLYNPINNSWAAWPVPLSVGRVNHACVLLDNNKVLIVGGNGNTPSSPNSISSYYVYNSNGTLNTSGNMNSTRRSFGMTLLFGGNNTVLVAGGINNSGSTLSSAELYTFANNTFTNVTSMNHVLKQNFLTLITSGTNTNDAVTINNSGFVAERFTSGQLNTDTHNLNSAWGSNAHNIYAVGNNGTILHGDGYGNWLAQSSGTSNNLRGVFGNSSTDIFVVGDNGTILHTTGNGSWTDQSISSTIDLYGVWSTASGGNRYYVVGQNSGSADGVVYISGGNGTWVLEHSLAQSIFQSVFGGLAGIYVSDTSSIFTAELLQRLPNKPVFESVGQLNVDSNLNVGASVTTLAAHVRNNIIISDDAGFISTGHILSLGTAPQIFGHPGAGAGGSFSISIVGTDTAGEITLTTGSSPNPAANAIIFTVSYNTVYVSDINTYVMITPSNDNAGKIVSYSWTFVSSDFQSFSLTSGNAALTASIQYKWQYHVIGVGVA